MENSIPVFDKDVAVDNVNPSSFLSTGVEKITGRNIDASRDHSNYMKFIEFEAFGTIKLHDGERNAKATYWITEEEKKQYQDFALCPWDTYMVKIDLITDSAPEKCTDEKSSAILKLDHTDYYAILAALNHFKETAIDLIPEDEKEAVIAHVDSLLERISAVAN